ncbi:ADP-ribose glycohydrolase OARD1 isoform X1 [Grammomys surdaster]|uniref:ADP-ribose glycohydrolase OARD1 isoform X1 n=1 Tax=Grammomys surdaster TaxID=491861 RepID=UPI00109EFF23|nr:ADP-ribose glycohydrolase OARD1 isoform X1 [Grammomys surdaster]XP_028622594.1 ADP-ribose glycohydrolase OARD1 isoform X1 [Grammomys surdaster]XP_028622595.1 ADP-ribose glycohydrolase OARD1 isoform X1 [Grammomys surdaster]XP_028622596.1 ADP-ribose glycohydrolase OARD1 isoform X1 [Grammomys surdaster]XP_028622597.1 ADP-ribose glycohydrolase OARD1 isoform X1 [Grammomys surdaster]
MASCLNEDPEGSRITYVKGDLFACPKTDSLAHCISEDCRMGAGIAVLFKKRFGGVQELLSQQKKSGEVAVLKRDGRYIYYLITKKRASHKPTYENLQKSLEAMKSHCLKNGVTDLSMPRQGNPELIGEVSSVISKPSLECRCKEVPACQSSPLSGGAATAYLSSSLT